MINGSPQHGHLKIWFTDLTKIDSAHAPIGKYLAILDEKERARYEHLSSTELKSRFLHGRILLRTLLADCLGSPPQNIELSTSSFGRPEFAKKNMPLSFNLSHSKDLIVCVASSGRVGIDLENTMKKRNFMDIAEHYFSENECQEMQRLSLEERAVRFYLLWTLKESYLKSKGESVLSLKRRTAFSVNKTGQIEFLQDKNYNFITFQPKPNYISSVAVEGVMSLSDNVSIEEVIPLVSRNKKELQLLGATSGSVKQVTKGESR